MEGEMLRNFPVTMNRMLPPVLFVKTCFTWYQLYFLDAQADYRKYEPKGCLFNRGFGDWINVRDNNNMSINLWGNSVFIAFEIE